MEMYYLKNKLYVNVEENINQNLVTSLQRRIYRIIDDYAINEVILNILTNEHYDSKLLDEFIDDYNSKYNGRLTIK